jgi:UDP-glucose 4-epimerase
VSIRKLAEMVVETLGSASRVELVPYTEACASGFEDMRRRRPNVNKLHAATGFRPTTPLQRIIEFAAGAAGLSPAESGGRGSATKGSLLTR